MAPRRRLPAIAISSVVVFAVVAAACGDDQAERSASYAELVAERDELAEALDGALADLAAADERLAELDDVLAAQAEAEQAEQADTSNAVHVEVSDDLTAILTLDLLTRVGLPERDAGCVAAAFVADGALRDDYLGLIGAGTVEAGSTEAAVERVAAAFTDCGYEPPAQQEPATAAEINAAIGEVEVIGDPLPEFADDFVDGVDPAVGLPAPVLVGADYEGTPVRVDPAADGPTMVVFLAHWCPHCNAEVPKLLGLQDDGRIPDGVQVVAVSTLVAPDRSNFPPAQWLIDSEWTFPTIADGVTETGQFVAAEAYGLVGVPYTVLVDGDGTVIGRWAGERDVTQIEAGLTFLAG